jgi:RNA polymerase sigma-70 factor (ECF subfamily)
MNIPSPANPGSTRWSVVLQAQQVDSPDARAAMETLCQIYWPVVFSYVRRRVPQDAEAHDLTQEFFAELLEKEFLQLVSPARGSFRGFLFAAIRHFLAKHWEKSRAQKRGGDRKTIALSDIQHSAQEYVEPVDSTTPDQQYDRQWANALTSHVMVRLEQSWRDAGKANSFEPIRKFLTAVPGPGELAIAAAQLGISPGAVRVAIHRLRRQYGDLLREEVARTLDSAEDIDAEIRWLVDVLAAQ